MPAKDGHLATDRKIYDLKEEAVKFFQSNRVPERLEEVLNSIFYEKPNDVYGRLSRHFEAMALAATISNVQASSVLDSTGNPALQCKIHCTIRNENMVMSSSRLSVDHEISLLPLPTEESEEKPSKNSVVPRCQQLVIDLLNKKLKNACPVNQNEIDSILRKCIDEAETKCFSPPMPDEEERTPTPSSGTKKKTSSAKRKGKPSDKPIPPYEPLEFRLQGCSAIPCTSIAVLKAGANFRQKSVAEHLHGISNKDTPAIKFPVPSINVISSGKASPGKLNIAKNIFIIAKPGLHMDESVQNLTAIFHQMRKILDSKTPTAPPSINSSGGLQPNYEKIEQPLELIQEAITAAGLTAGQDIFIGIECSAHEVFDHGKGKYEVSTGVLKSADEIIDYYRDVVMRYPSVIALTDPLRKEDREQWPKLCETLSEKCFIVGSDAVYGSMHNFDSSSLEVRPSSGISLSLGGRVTVTDIVGVQSAVGKHGLVTIVTSAPGDVCDTILTDFAVGLNCGIVRFGSPARGENSERLNRLVEIEQELQSENISYQTKFIFPVIKPVPPPADDVPTSAVAVSATPESKSKKK